jgi:parallel beta-helix repeat protein
MLAQVVGARVRTIILASVTVGALMSLAPAATAAPITCGGTITSDVTLEADLVCPFVSVITVEADRVTVDLGGHRIDGAILVVDGHDRVTIRDGQLLQLHLTNSDRNRVLNVVLPAGDGLLLLTDSHRNLVEGNDVGSAFGVAVWLVSSERNVIRGNMLRGFQSNALVLDGASDRNEITGNTAGASQAAAISIGGSRNLVSGNTASAGGGSAGGFASEAIHIFSGQRNVVERNDVVSNTDGILVDLAAGRTVVAGNRAHGSDDDGIDVESPSTTLRDNTANDNGDLGIEAVPGVRDAGGNSASGNGNPLQCLNVACG